MMNSQLSQQAAAKELLARRKARESLAGFCHYIDVPGAPVSEDEDELDWVFKPIETGLAAHHLLMFDAFERVFEGEINNLMVFMPPGGAKSTYGSAVFPTWCMGKKPGYQIILGSYASKLARKHGRKARSIVRSKKYQNVFETGISSDSSAAEEWRLNNSSEYMSGGLLSGITGNRADGIIVDDPIKGRQDADSEVIRDKTWDAYEEDLLTRLKPGGWQIIIQTRWHDDDLSGRILPDDYDGATGWVTGKDGQKWYVISLAAQCEREDDPLGREVGEYLWPEWFTPEHFAKFKSRPRTWSALFQQRPQADDGDFFKRDWFKRYELGEHPKHVNTYGSSDYAVSDGKGDFTELGIGGVDDKDDLWIIDWWYGQKTTDVWIEELLNLVEKHKPLAVLGEKGVIQKAIEPPLLKRSRERKVYARWEWVARTADKAAMARAFQARASMGKVWIPNCPWGDRLIEMLVKFPAGKYDDAVDVCALFGLMLDGLIPGIDPSNKKEQQSERDCWGRRKQGSNSWTTQ